MHVEEEALSAGGRVGPAHRRGRTFADGNARRGLAERNRNLGAVLKSRSRNVMAGGAAPPPRPAFWADSKKVIETRMVERRRNRMGLSERN